MESAGEIRNLRVHTPTKLMCGDRPILIRSERYKVGRHAVYTDDFRYEERGPDGWALVVEDFKGWDMPEARFRRAEASDEVVTPRLMAIHYLTMATARTV